MYVITLKFADKTRAGALMESHNAWIAQGFDDGVFLLVGSLQPNAGGAIIANGASRDEIETRVSVDPFVAEGVVTADILEIVPGRTAPELAVLKV